MVIETTLNTEAVVKASAVVNLAMITAFTALEIRDVKLTKPGISRMGLLWPNALFLAVAAEVLL